MEANGISIVIATKGRVELLEDLLISVQEARNNFIGDSEVLLIDDSNENDVIRIEEMCRKYDAVRIEFGPSVAQKRNIGAGKAQYDIILFLDSDCIATPNLLNEHYKLYDCEEVGGVAGYLEFVGEDTWFWEAVDKTPFTDCFSYPKWMDTVPWTPTANCSIRKKVFEEINGFDRSFPDKPGGEDVDLGLRMIKAGYVFRCTADGMVYHSKKTWIPVKAMIRRLWHYGVADYYLADKHPDYVKSIRPRKTFIYMIVLITAVVAAVVSAKPAVLPVTLCWFVIDIMLSALFINTFIPDKRTSFLKQCVVQLLILDNEMGYVSECCRRGKFSYINKDTFYSDRQIEEFRDTRKRMIWCNTLSLILLISSVLLIILYV